MFQPKVSKSLILLSSSTSLEGKNKVFELFIGNLRFEPSDSIIRKLQQVFRSVNVEVPDTRISVLRRKNKLIPAKYAFVRLTDEKDQNAVFNLHNTRIPDVVLSNTNLVVKPRDYSIGTVKHDFRFNGQRRLKHSTSTPTFNRNQHIRQQTGIVTGKREIIYGQYLPNEDRTIEYKRGSGNFLKNSLIPVIRKYICAFLNSEGGRLLIGVDDNCQVFGVSCDRKQEDQARCTIDNAIKQFSPHVLPNLYEINFIPVKLCNTDELCFSDAILKVIEVTVNKPDLLNNLYINDRDEVYIRRDGSVEGPLKASQIVEWCKAHFTHQHNNKRFCTEDVVIAKESFGRLEHYEHMYTTVTENQRRIEEELKNIQRKLLANESRVGKDLEEAKNDLLLSNLTRNQEPRSGRTHMCVLL